MLQNGYITFPTACCVWPGMDGFILSELQQLAFGSPRSIFSKSLLHVYYRMEILYSSQHRVRKEWLWLGMDDLVNIKAVQQLASRIRASQDSHIPRVERAHPDSGYYCSIFDHITLIYIAVYSNKQHFPVVCKDTQQWTVLLLQLHAIIPPHAWEPHHEKSCQFPKIRVYSLFIPTKNY